MTQMQKEWWSQIDFEQTAAENARRLNRHIESVRYACRRMGRSMRLAQGGSGRWGKNQNHLEGEDNRRILQNALGRIRPKSIKDLHLELLAVREEYVSERCVYRHVRDMLRDDVAKKAPYPGEVYDGYVQGPAWKWILT